MVLFPCYHTIDTSMINDGNGGGGSKNFVRWFSSWAYYFTAILLSNTEAELEEQQPGGTWLVFWVQNTAPALPNSVSKYPCCVASRPWYKVYVDDRSSTLKNLIQRPPPSSSFPITLKVQPLQTQNPSRFSSSSCIHHHVFQGCLLSRCRCRCRSCRRRIQATILSSDQTPLVSWLGVCKLLVFSCCHHLESNAKGRDMLWWWFFQVCSISLILTFCLTILLVCTYVMYLNPHFK